MALTLLPYQIEPKNKLRDALIKGEGMLLVAPTQTGKTYALSQAIFEAQQHVEFNARQKGPTSVLFLTQKSIRIQTLRVCKAAGLKNIFVESIDALARGAKGEIFIEWVSRMVKGEMSLIPIWREEMKPAAIILDECQGAKNPASLRSQIIIAAIEQGIPVIMASATPFAKISEARSVCLATGLADNYSWPRFANNISGNTRPDELNSAAIKRLNDQLEGAGKLVKFQDIHYNKRTMNRCIKLKMQHEWEKKRYNVAYQEYLEKLIKENRNSPEGVRAIWVAQVKYQIAAEEIKAPYLAIYGIERVKAGEQVIIASKYIQTLRICWNTLVKNGVDKSRIGFIIGGQNDKVRQQMVDDFQEGKLDYLLNTIKSGGVGLTLLHLNPVARPRRVILPPTWSAQDLIQVLGRAHGPASISTTHQDVVWFEETIEEEVCDRLAEKFKCIKEIVTRKEVWTDLFTGAAERELVGKLNELEKEENKDVDEDGEEIVYSAEGLFD